jgi:hypothetical protein
VFKLTRWFLLGLIVPVLVVTTERDSASLIAPRVDNFAFIENQLLTSSRYTQVDETDASVLDNFEDNFQLRFTPSELATMGFIKRLENSQFNLYFETQSFSLILENKSTGYMFSSRPEFQGYSQTREDNTANRNLMNSGLWIESIRTSNVASSAIKVESLYTIADVSYENNGAQDLTAIDLTKPYIINANSYDTRRVDTQFQSLSNTAFAVNVDVKLYGFTLRVEIHLTAEGFAVHFDANELEETNPVFAMLGVQFFPYFGSAREAIYPGYFVIPDGIGAMVRTNTAYDQTYQSDYYGSDLGYLRPSIGQLSLPIYGIVHQVGHAGFYHEITSGAEHATLLANFWGRNTRYHRMTNRFNVRRIYRNIINRAGDGRDVLPEEKVTTIYQGEYRMLMDQQASYVGMANAYQNQLVNRQIFTTSLEPNQTPIQLAMLMYEQEPTFFGTSRITMTSPQALQTIREALQAANVDQQLLVLKGWSSDGLAYRQPFTMQTPNQGGLTSLIETIQADGDAVYLDQDYVVSSELADRINFNRDVARNYSKLKMSYPLNRLDNQPIDEYYVYPDVADAKLRLDQPALETLGADGFAFSHLGNTLYSYYDEQRFSRSATLHTFTEMASRMPSNAMHRPSAYMFPYLHHYLDMPITNSQLDLFTDLIPLVPMVLKGYIPTFTPYLNFNALGKERLLQMVDFGVNPSYILTQQPSSLLRFTYSNKYFTTAYDDFSEDMVNVYTYVANALDQVSQQRIVARSMITTGVSEVIYSNGVKIMVNYRSQPFTTNGVTIPGLDYRVIA